MAGEIEATVESMEMDLLVDRISELPEFILHNILSLLDTKEACRACVLSKKWHEAWSSIPVLDFQTQYFKQRSSAYPRIYFATVDYLTRFLSFVAKTMERYAEKNHGIRKLYVTFPMHIGSEPVLNKWVGIAVQNKVQELEIQLLGPDTSEYRLPEVLFTARSLKVLKCDKVKLLNYGTMKLSSLEHLGLYNSVVDENMLQRIISSCPLITLVLRGCWPLGNISLPWMNAVSDTEMAGELGRKRRHSNIKTCSLRYLCYHGSHSPSPWPFKMNMAALKNLRELEIFEADITDDIVSELTSGLSALETLSLALCSLLRHIKISSFSLKKLTVVGCQELDKATIDAPNLAWFSFDVNLRLNPAQSLININSELKPALSIINIQEHCNARLFASVKFPDSSWFVKLKEFLMGTKVFGYIHMRTGWDPNNHQIVADEEQLQRINSRPPYKLREFKLDDTCFCELRANSVSALLDLLFWCCHPDVLSIPTNFQNTALEMILNILNEKVSCWKHPLKGIEVEHVDSSTLFWSSIKLEIRLRLSW